MDKIKLVSALQCLWLFIFTVVGFEISLDLGFSTQFIIIMPFVWIISYIIFFAIVYKEKKSWDKALKLKENYVYKKQPSAEELYEREIENKKPHGIKYKHARYIINNNEASEKAVQMFTPDFSADSFIKYAKNAFIQKYGIQTEPETYYLHNYIIGFCVEQLKIYIKLSDNNEYFANFTRKNPMIYIKSGGIVAVKCPSCGADIVFEDETMQVCEYCKNTVTFKDGGWLLDNVERITPDTYIVNKAVIKL